MSNKYQRDETYLRKIRSGDEALVKQLFYEFREPFVAFFLKQHQLSRAIILDIYLKSFATFHEKARKGELTAPLNSTLQVYIIGIGKNKVKQYWDDRSGDRMRLVGDEELMKTHFFVEPQAFSRQQEEANRDLIDQLLKQLNEKCRNLLRLKYLQGFAYDAIAQRLNIASENAARQQTFQCIKKLRGLMNSD
ncbi:MAG: sigma-70 family RNA polymerase sigma factor [Bacteroidota bacterium]